MFDLNKLQDTQKLSVKLRIIIVVWAFTNNNIL